MINETEKLRQISPQEFAHFGMQDIAYVRLVVTDETTGWAIFSADGQQVAVMRDRDVALAAVRQHDLEPLSVH